MSKFFRFGYIVKRRPLCLLLCSLWVGEYLGFAQGPQINKALVWDNILLQSIRDTKPGPPMVARDIAIVHTAMFDAWAAYDGHADGTRLGAALRRPERERTLENKEKAISFAAYRALMDLFPTEAAMYTAEMAELGYDPNDTSLDIRKPSGIGNMAAAALVEYRHHDGSNQLGDLHPGAYSDYTGFAPVNDPDHINNPDAWQPLRVSDGKGGLVVQKYVGAQWGLVTPFALSSGDELRPHKPPVTVEHDLKKYREQADALLNISANLRDEQKVIAEYWADGPNSELPPGHWCLIAQFVSARDQHSLDDDVKMFFMVGNAVMDAGIAAWDAKRAYDSVRPVTAIHYLYTGQQVRAWGGPFLGTQTIDGADWQPYQAATVVTPPFPEFISGHSTFSAAAAEVLRRFTGSDAYGGSFTALAGSSKFEPGTTPGQNITLSWATFSDAADQAGLSRRYGGIHFEDGDLTGRKIGRKVGERVWRKAQEYIEGRHEN